MGMVALQIYGQRVGRVAKNYFLKYIEMVFSIVEDLSGLCGTVLLAYLEAPNAIIVKR